MPDTEPRLGVALRQLTRAVEQTLSLADVEAEPRQERKPWPCGVSMRRAFAYSYDVKAKHPREFLKAAVAQGRAWGLEVTDDSSNEEVHPSATFAGELFELGVYAFPERGEVWIAGNTVCLAGEVPEGWRGV